MTVELSNEAMAQMEDGALIEACFAPLIRAYKEASVQGEGATAALFGQLSEGQRALFLVKAYTNHALKSAEELYWWSAYFMAQPSKWRAIKEAYAFVGDREGERFLAEMEDKLAARGLRAADSGGLRASMQDLDTDEGLRAAMAALHERLRAGDVGMVRLLAACIRSRPDDFLTELA